MRALGLLAAGAAATTLMAAPGENDWPMFGQNAANTASNQAEGLTAGNVSRLKVKWTLTTAGDVSVRASVVAGVAYFPDWGGKLWAVNASTGSVIWSHQLTDYVGTANGPVHSRTSPAVVGGMVYVGTQEGGAVLAIHAASGSLAWQTRLEPTDPFAVVTTSPSVVNGVVYTGVASIAEGGTAYGITVSSVPARGSAVALDASTGAIKWKTYMVPVGYSGGGVWGGNPVVDSERNTVFVGTGNNYLHPSSSAVSSVAGKTYAQCIAAGGTAASCESTDDHVDSVVALNMRTGAIKWAKKMVTWGQALYGVTDGSDDWNVDCFFHGPQCPANAGPDYDFASAPNEITYNGKDGRTTILGVGQKSGIYYALDPDTGAEKWRTQVGPGSSLGGMEWGSASDGKRIYVSIANFYGIPSAAGSAGSWAALDPATGDAILWQKADPNGAIDIGPLAVANGVVYASSMGGAPGAPTMLALDAVDGKTLWSFAAGSSVNAGATIAKGMVLWGSGYSHLGIPGFTGNNKFYGFSKSESDE